MRFILLPGGAGGAAPRLRSGSRTPALLFSLPSVVFAMSIFTFPFMVMSIGTALVQRGPDARGGGRLPRRAAVADVPAGDPAADPGGHGRRDADWCSAGASGRSPSRCCWARLNEQRALAWTLYQRGVVQTDYGLVGDDGHRPAGRRVRGDLFVAAVLARSPRRMSETMVPVGPRPRRGRRRARRRGHGASRPAVSR